MIQPKQKAAPLPSATVTPKHRSRQWRNDLTAYLFLSPYLLLFFLFLLLPAIFGVFISFTNWDILGSPSWSGLKNYQTIFKDALFIKSISNTFYFMLLTAPPMILVGLGLAVLLNQRLRGTALARTVVFLPYVLTVSVVGVVWSWIYQPNVGLLNFYLQMLGLSSINWLGTTTSAMPALAITTLWWTVNVNMIIYLAGLQDIPAELYEAAELDGAGSAAKFRFVTLPLLLPINAFVIPLTVISAWRVFGQAYVMTQGGPEASTYVMAQYTYLMAFQNFQMGPASASAVILLLITLVFSLIQLRAFRVL
jgi:multiple sugar transport system permease protein